MTNEQTVLLNIIKVSPFGYEYTLPENVDWDGVFKEAKNQTVVSLCSSYIPKEQAGKWEQYTFAEMAHYVRVMHEQDQLCKLFTDNGIPLVILKGTAAAMYYPVPSRRSIGDIDFLVPQDRFADAKKLMNAGGYAPENVKSERHYSYNKNGVHFELHHHFSSHGLDIEKYLIEAFPNRALVSIDGHEFPVLPWLENGLVLLAHVRQHLLSGLGLRQIIDWMMFVHKYLDDEHWEKFKPVAESVGLLKLATVTTKLCKKYLGLPDDVSWRDAADDETVDKLIDNLLVSGNFGRNSGKGHSVEIVSTNFKRMGFFGYLQFAGEDNWKAYKKYKFLRPFAWIYQIFRYICQGLATHRNAIQLNCDLRRGKDRYDLLRKLDLE